MSKETRTRRHTAASIGAMKGKTPIVSLTAYDAPTAALLDPHCEFLLVGDSVGMVVHGLPSTVGVTMEMMMLHARAVMRGTSQALVVVDMPFGTYEDGPQTAFTNAARIMAETGAGAVKIEAGTYTAEIVAFLTERGIPVMAHVGLRPQSAHVTGGFRAVGRTPAEADAVLAEARAADGAGAFAIVVEGVDEELGKRVTEAVRAPTIGIGASAACDGQILVTPDMLGLFERTPTFVRVLADMRGLTTEAVKTYAEAVRSRSFPGADEVYRLTS